MSATNFDACLAVTLKYEGGYSNNPHDPGGATYEGVTQRVYSAYERKNGLADQHVALMSEAARQDIYRVQYWNVVQGDELPAGLDMCVFDIAVNSGTGEAGTLLQRALISAGQRVDVDGQIGLETMAAVKDCQNVPFLIKGVCAARMSFWRRLRTWQFFGKGWAARGLGVQQAALAMAASAASAKAIA